MCISLEIYLLNIVETGLKDFLCNDKTPYFDISSLCFAVP